MRNVFENLEYKRELKDNERIIISTKMYELLFEEFTHKIQRLRKNIMLSLGDIETKMGENCYYILNDHTIQIRKKIFFKGRLVVAYKKEILEFFKKEDLLNEEIKFICMPANDKPGFIMMNNEDWNFHYVQLNQSLLS
jgi:hypothetical protein